LQGGQSVPTFRGVLVKVGTGACAFAYPTHFSYAFCIISRSEVFSTLP
jgi:hypothetical protein